MSEKQKLLYFKSAFETGDAWPYVKNYSYISIFECFLDWPLRDFFLPTMNLFWGITPKENYGRCLLSLARKSKKVSQILFYDFQFILCDLWEQTPDDYKQYALCHKTNDNEDSFNTVIKGLFKVLSERDPFQQKDVAFFKRIWCDLPQEEKKAIMCCSIGRCIIWNLIEKEKWSLVNWMVQNSIPNKEITKFKEQFIKSNYYDVFLKLQDGCEEFVEKIINWSFELVSDKTQYKWELINFKLNGLNIPRSTCSYSLKEGNFTKVERVMNFFLDNEMKRQFQLNVVENSCSALFKDGLLEQIDKILAWHLKTEDEIKTFKSNNGVFNVDVVKSNCCALLHSMSSSSNPWEQMNKILAWKFDTEEQIKDFKKDLFKSDGINIHYNLVFIKRQWDQVQCFYEWFCLSPEKRVEIKTKTIFSADAMEYVHEALYIDANTLLEPLQWCLTTEEMVISFKELIEEQYFTEIEYYNMENAKICLDNLMFELLQDFTEDHNKTSNETSSDEDKGRKRSFVVEDESSSASGYKHLKVEKY